MKNQETVADAEFKAEPYDNEGTLVLCRKVFLQKKQVPQEG